MGALHLGLYMLLQLPVGSDTTVVTVPVSLDRVTLEAVEEFRLGDAFGPVETSFGLVSSVATNDRGDVFIADAQAPILRKFTSDGGFLGEVGHEGEGPGEYRSIDGVARLHSGEMAVWDPALARVTIYDAEDEYQRSFPVEIGSILGGPVPAFVYAETGHFLIRTSQPMQPRRPGERPPDAAPAWLRYTASGAFVDSVIPLPRHVDGVFAGFKIETMTAPSPTGQFVVGRNDSYSLEWGLAGGGVLRVVREYTPVGFSGGERDQWEVFVAEWERRWDWQSSALPASKPPWRQLLVGVDGRVWVERFARAFHQPGHVDYNREKGGWPQIEWREPMLLDVFSRDGDLIGQVEIGPAKRLLYADGGRFWTLEVGEFDEEQVVQYRLQDAG